MLGVVNLDKPVGPTSHDMVGLVRRLSGMRRIGHAGTLDPLASGVLPVLVGAATRFSEELTGGTKRYEAVVRLGARSATDDAEGPITAGSQPPSFDEAVAALARFVGTFEQRPPAYSARKVGGRTAYRAARMGVVVDLAARAVRVDALELRGFEAGTGWLDLHLDLRCGPGTYVRSIARDLGEQLGCGGYLAGLRRTEAAGLSLESAVTAAQLEELAADGRLAEAVLPIGGLLSLPELTLDAVGAARFRHGLPVSVGDPRSGGRYAVHAGADVIGVGVLDDGTLRPVKVLSAARR
ncbi:MAG: tRNA pseudouridine(55) synthase TruB [Candidatus Limnocylindria bacterium]